MEFKLKAQPIYSLISEQGREIQVQRIGKGQFTTAYRATEDPTVVYLVVKESQDASKEIFRLLGGGAHLPEMESLGYLGESRVYKTRYYEPLRACHRDAWVAYKALVQCRQLAWDSIYRPGVATLGFDVTRGYDVNLKTVDLLREKYPELESVAEALDRLTDWAASYSNSYTIEFAPRNLAVDEQGRLVLLDVLFDLAVVEKARLARVKRAAAAYRL